MQGLTFNAKGGSSCAASPLDVQTSLLKISKHPRLCSCPELPTLRSATSADSILDRHDRLWVCDLGWDCNDCSTSSLECVDKNVPIDSEVF